MKLFKRISKKLDRWDSYGIKRMRILLVALIVTTISFALQIGLPDPQSAEVTINSDLIFGALNDYESPEVGKVKRRDSVVILGYRSADYGFDPTYWVQTKDGERGEVSQFAFDNDFLALKKNKKLNIEVADTVKIKPNPSEEDTYIVTNSEGESETIPLHKLKDYVSVRANESLASHERTTMGTYMSQGRFERNFMGKEIDESYADYIRKYGTDSTVVRYGIRVLVKEEGYNGFYNPVVRYDSNGIAESYTLSNRKKLNGSGKILSYMPLSEYIIDIFGWTIDNKYGFSPSLKPTSIATDNIPRNIGIGILAVTFGVIALSWLFLMNHFFLALVFSILPFRVPLQAFSNRTLYTALMIILIPTTYIWIVVMLANGGSWWLTIPAILYTTYLMHKKFYKRLIVKPVFRCDVCKEIGTKHLTNRVFLRSRIETEVTKSTTGISYGTRSVNATITDSNGRQRQGKKDIGTKTTSYVLTKHKYKVDTFGATYVCGVCDSSEYVTEEDRSHISSENTARGSETRDS